MHCECLLTVYYFQLNRYFMGSQRLKTASIKEIIAYNIICFSGS
jgi:hypothetical protein